MKAKQLFFNQSSEGSFSVRNDYMPNVNSRWHFHEEVELICFHRGAGLQFVGDSITRFSAGDVVLVGSNLPHYWRYDEGTAYASEQMPFSTVLHFHPLLLGDAFMRLPESVNLCKLLALSGRGMSLRGKGANHVVTCIHAIDRSEGLPRLVNLLQCLATLLTWQKELMPLSSVGFRYQVDSADEDRINKLYAYSFQHFANPITLGEVAELIGLGRTSFCRFFKKSTGKTYSHFLAEIRIGHACKLLLSNPSEAIKSICYESGYRNFTSFNEAFRKMTGMSPKKYRACHGLVR